MAYEGSDDDEEEGGLKSRTGTETNGVIRGCEVWLIPHDCDWSTQVGGLAVVEVAISSLIPSLEEGVAVEIVGAPLFCCIATFEGPIFMPKLKSERMFDF